VDDVVDPLAERGSRGDGVEGPEKPGVLARLQLDQLVSWVLHLSMMAKALLARHPEEFRVER
jgi:hypothetical protein